MRERGPRTLRCGSRTSAHRLIHGGLRTGRHVEGGPARGMRRTARSSTGPASSVSTAVRTARGMSHPSEVATLKANQRARFSDRCARARRDSSLPSPRAHGQKGQVHEEPIGERGDGAVGHSIAIRPSADCGQPCAHREPSGGHPSGTQPRAHPAVSSAEVNIDRLPRAKPNAGPVGRPPSRRDDEHRFQSPATPAPRGAHGGGKWLPARRAWPPLGESRPSSLIPAREDPGPPTAAGSRRTTASVAWSAAASAATREEGPEER